MTQHQPAYSLGLDYGTNSCRCVLLDLQAGVEAVLAVYPYPSGHQGILTDPANPGVARQNPRDYIQGLESVVKEVLTQAKQRIRSFHPDQIVGIGVDTTGSTVIPVDEEGTPLCFLPEFEGDLDAMVWLWKDHSAHDEADQITQLAQWIRTGYLDSCGGKYSSEWFWSKILRIKKQRPDIYNAAYSFVEHCDYIPALLTGNSNPLKMKRSICAAAHKALYSPSWGGLPDAEFLDTLSPGLSDLRENLYSEALPAGLSAGKLSTRWARQLGLPKGLAVSVGAFDAHMGAVGAGIKPGRLVKIIGTSTCDLMIAPLRKRALVIPGVCGVAPESVLPGKLGIEAGQSAVGDIFLWWVHNMVPDVYGNSQEEKFDSLLEMASTLAPGYSGLLALDWNNGNRSLLTDTQLTGLILGQTLHTRAHEVYRTLIEATAFGAYTIINRLEEFGITVKEVVNCGGLAKKNPLLMQIYADVTRRPMKVAQSEQTCAVGAAIFGAAAAGYDSLKNLQARASHLEETEYSPDMDNHKVYQELFTMYCKIHDAFGGIKNGINLQPIMKDLIRLRDQQREGAYAGIA